VKDSDIWASMGQALNRTAGGLSWATGASGVSP